MTIFIFGIIIPLRKCVNCKYRWKGTFPQSIPKNIHCL